MTKQDFIIQNVQTGWLVSSVGSERRCRDLAAFLNDQYQTDAYQVVPYLPGEDGLTK